MTFIDCLFSMWFMLDQNLSLKCIKLRSWVSKYIWKISERKHSQKNFSGKSHCRIVRGSAYIILVDGEDCFTLMPVRRRGGGRGEREMGRKRLEIKRDILKGSNITNFWKTLNRGLIFFCSTKHHKDWVPKRNFIACILRRVQSLPLGRTGEYNHHKA